MAKKKEVAKKMKAQDIFKTRKEADEYHKKNPYAASHPYAGGHKLKPEGAPAPYQYKNK